MGARHVAVAFTMVAVALAGCADLQEDGRIGADQAREIWQSAFSNAERFENLTAIGIEATAEADGSEVFSYQIQVAPDEGAFLFQLSMDPSLSGSDSPAPATLLSDLTMGQAIEDGVEHTFLPNLTGQTKQRRDHVPDEQEFGSFGDVNQATGSSSTADQNLGPDFGTVGLNDHGENITVEEVTTTTIEGKAAWTIQFSFENETMTASGEMSIYKENRLPARGSYTVNATGNATGGHPVLNAGEVTVTVEFRYDDQVEVTLPDAERAPPRVETLESPTQDEGNISGSISPSYDDEVPLDEIELRITSVVEGSGNPFGSKDDPDEVHFTMSADAGSKEGDEFALSYTDEDGDGYLSANDTYSATIKNESMQGEVELHWYDTWSGLYVYQPGFEALAVIAAAGAAVALLRRRD